jgi:hypothetical protein
MLDHVVLTEMVAKIAGAGGGASIRNDGFLLVKMALQA